MVEIIMAVNNAVNNFIWGVPAMICILGVGMFLSIRTGFLQIRKFPYAIRTTIGRMFRKKDASDGSMTPSRQSARLWLLQWEPEILQEWRGRLPSAAREPSSGCGVLPLSACVPNLQR